MTDGSRGSAADAEVTERGSRTSTRASMAVVSRAKRSTRADAENRKSVVRESSLVDAHARQERAAIYTVGGGDTTAHRAVG